MSKKSIQYCGIPIEYTLTRKPVKNMNVRINEKGEILVSAKSGLPVEQINQFIEHKAEWIIRTLAAVERYNMTKPDSDVYIGKKCYYLGMAYVMDIKKSQEAYVGVEKNVITVFTKDPADTQKVKMQYLAWLKKEAITIFNQSLFRMYSLAEKENIPLPKINIRNMKTRWGSCSPSSQKITLNLQLVKADMDCIDHVVLHELMHFKQADHGREFYSLIDKYITDWKERRSRLNEKYKDGI